VRVAAREIEHLAGLKGARIAVDVDGDQALQALDEDRAASARW
jgi:hypothetical protein